MTSSARFHADHANLRVRTEQVTTGESFEIVCRWLTGNRDPVSKWIGKRSLNMA
jgi:hypothetical protein